MSYRNMKKVKKKKNLQKILYYPDKKPNNYQIS